MECPIINTALSLMMKHLVTGQRQKAPNFSDFHWSPHGSLVSIGQHFVTTRVEHLPKRTETSLITESDRSGLNWWFRGLTGGFLLLRIFSVGISVSPYVCFILYLILISMFLR